MADALKGFSWARGRRMLAWGMVSVVLGAAVREAAWGQVVSVLSADVSSTEEAGPEAAGGFQVAKEDSKTLDKLEDFNRYSEKRAWELAFRTMNSLAAGEGSGAGMVPVGNGFMMPLRRKITQSLVGLPADGREAYRLFYDAEAKQLWQQLKSSKDGGGAAELRNLQKITNQFFLTSVGDLATDRLGDLLFERGDFGGAEGMWQMVTRDYPDTHLQLAKVEVKRCVALAWMGRHEDLALVAGTVKENYADQKVTIGGEEVLAGEFVEKLLKEAGADETAKGREGETAKGGTGAEEVTPVDLEGQEVAWQIRVAPAGTLEKMDSSIQAQGWGYRGFNFSGTVPGAAVDGKRLYVNWLGVVYAADVETGKMLWRTGKFSDVPGKAIQFLQYGVDPTHMLLAAAGGKVFASAGFDPQRGERGGQIQCLDGATGKVLWKGDKFGSTSVSMPTVVGGTGYLVGSANGDTSYLIAFNLETGAQEWRVGMGKMQLQQNNYNGQMEPVTPEILVTTGMVYVATNNGALVAVNTAQRRVEWAFKHETKLDTGQRGWNGYDTPKAFETEATLLLDRGILYVKDSGGRKMYAVDPLSPSLKWRRPINEEDMMVGVEGDRAILMGKDLSAMDLRTRKLLWSTKLPVTSGGMKPLITKGHIYVSTPRGFYDVDPSNGDILHIFRGSDRESGGGRLFVADGKLVCVSDGEVTAYKVKGH